MRKKLIILIICIIIISCKKNEDKVLSIDGKWIESTQQKDTLYFESSNLMFDLRRGKELNNGNLIPKINSGLYMYETKVDSISIQYLLSSQFKPKNYNFNLDLNKGKITIENFYVDSLDRNVRLIFLRFTE